MTPSLNGMKVEASPRFVTLALEEAGPCRHSWDRHSGREYPRSRPQSLVDV